MHCPSCSIAMESVALASHVGTTVNIDVCGPCHVIWFDHMESTSLSPGSVIELFKRLYAARGSGRNLLKIMVACPHCQSSLKSTTDLAKGGRFSYSRCANGHGRLISFSQFLREKNFLRSLQPHEISALSVKVKQIRCSSCGGPINLEADKACTHCGAAISVLDEAAVEKALLTLQAREVQRTTPDPSRMNQVLLAPDAAERRARIHTGMQHSPTDWLNEPRPAGALTDLVEVGIGAVLALWLSN
ncbi:MAG: zf-TFIIB domain-containing protein [Burkholderiales bacterium]|nr:zf-TFIIB domain-containing protein [Burkholderiales bacterium]